MDVRRTIGLNVVRLRRERGVSQEELSFRSKRTRAYLSGLESGQRNPTAVTLDSIAKALGVSIIELFQPPPEGDQLRPERGSSKNQRLIDR